MDGNEKKTSKKIQWKKNKKQTSFPIEMKSIKYLENYKKIQY